ncbi:MAG: flagellar basal-body rod protein FlgG [Defluviitaleaceae bacterium]|nr:flagellar basal-body rod protein FlgG [Defluviitaleaceae bacterium]MCL2835502.1 flagellar basal-body rod protein FlgG [Defluviitaleaceae bacterium]
MMRSLWTGASGMIAQQTNVDVIANNLANVNTTGYKKERLEFKSLLYQTLAQADLDPANGMGSRPVNLQVGLGVRPVATARMFDRGNLEVTENNLDFAIEGFGFFAVETPNGVAYTRDGCFKLATTVQGSYLVTSDGYMVLSTDGGPIILPPEVTMHDVEVDYRGRFLFMGEEGEQIELGFQLEIVQFSNTQGLEAVGSNLFRETVASGLPLSEPGGDVPSLSKVIQGVREMPNVQIAEEMVRLIIAQRAYEINSKVISTSDDMLQTANGLKRP